MKKRILLLFMISCLLSGCESRSQQPYRYTEYGVFDTVTTILGYGGSEDAFEIQAKEICSRLQEYHRLFDIYHSYEGVHNLKTVNDQAGLAPVHVDPVILDLLQRCREYEKLTEGTVNPAMGSVLTLWHEQRALAEESGQGAIPAREALEEAKKHMDFENVELDFENQTVFLKDPAMRLDVGAIAKGYAAQLVSCSAPEGMLISIGGNVCATGPKPNGKPWTVGIQDPNGQGYLKTLALTEGSAVTSGDYQRYYEVDGKRYHHIIDPETCMPGTCWRSVTVVCPDSGLADALSTALFLLPRDRGQALLQQTGAQAMWVDESGEIFLSPGFPE